MKKHCYFIVLCCIIYSKSFSQEIKIKHPFFETKPQYFYGEQYIGNSTQELLYFIETHSQDSLIIYQLNESDRLSNIYPKIYLYSGGATLMGAIGLGYVYAKAIGSIFNPNNADPYLGTLAKTSLGFMIVGVIGIAVAGGYFLASQIKLKKAIKGYNNSIRDNKISINFQPYIQGETSGLTLCIRF